MQVGPDARPTPVVDASTADLPADAAPTDATDSSTVDLAAELPPPSDCDSDSDCLSADPCLVGRCDGNACAYAPAPTLTPCDDGDPCTPSDACDAGVCQGSGALACADDDPCTDDRCAPGLGCQFAALTCDDGDACTTDACRPGTGCVATPLTCPAATDPCRTQRCDPSLGCVATPLADGTACDDGLACTLDRCVAGTCVGTASDCDDGNACTLDTCDQTGACSHQPVLGCANEPACLGVPAGGACDDDDPTTQGDLCLFGTCRGFALTRLRGTVVPDQQGLVIREVDHHDDRWSAIFWTIDLLLAQRHVLAEITSASAPTIHTATQQRERFSGLFDGFVGDDDGHLWSLDAGVWTRGGPWDAALGQSGRAPLTTLFGVSAPGPGGTARAMRLLWLGGDDDGEWLRLCKHDQSVTCAPQTLANDDGASIPRAIAGVPECDAAGACDAAVLALAADAPVGGGFHFTDTYTNANGLAASWAAGFSPQTPANRASRAIAAWSTAGGVAFFVAGANGYLRLRRADGAWRGPLVLRESQSSRDFSAAFAGAGVLVVTAHRPVSNDRTAFELWVAPLDADLEDDDTWVVHELGRYPRADADGLYDLDGSPTGELRAVGAVRRADDLFDWLDGAIWVRTP